MIGNTKFQLKVIENKEGIFFIFLIQVHGTDFY